MKGAWLFVLALPLAVCLSCQQKIHKSPLSKELSFEDMSGRDLECWKYVIAPNDLANFSFYKELFERVKNDVEKLPADKAIPCTLHFIWLGPKEFPRESIPNVLSWMEKHPGWKVKFWSDRVRLLPSNDMELVIVDHLSSQELDTMYYKTDNFAERSDLLRYEILMCEGGVYVDHDVKCFKNISNLTDAFEFICGLELPADTPVASSVHATNSLIGSRPAHPILKRCIRTVAVVWDEMERLYPGSDKISVIRRVANRTFAAFADSVRALAGSGTKDMVAPAYYFGAPSDEKAVYARHLYAGTWYQNDNPFEKMVRQRLMMLSKKVNKILLFIGVSVAINLFAIAFFFSLLWRKFQKNSGCS